MAYRENHKQFNAEIPKELFDTFSKQRKTRGQVKNDVATAAFRLWIDLPVEIQARLLSGEPPSMLIELVHSILDKKISEGIEFAENLSNNNNSPKQPL